MTYFKLLKKRLNQFIDLELEFLTDFVHWKLELYSYRFQHYSFANWWLLFVWSVVFYLNYGLLRFSIYSVSVTFRFLFLPLRLAVELYLPPVVRPVFFFVFSIFETVGGILWVRENFLGFVEEVGNAIVDRWESQKQALFDRWDRRNPVIAFFDRLVRIDRWFERLARRTKRWLIYRLYRYWLRWWIPETYRTARRWVLLRYGYFRFRSRRFRKWRLRKEYGLYLQKCWETGIVPIHWNLTRSTIAAYFLWGGEVLQLLGRFLGKVLKALVSSSATIGRRLRYPSEEGGHRYRLSRFYPRPISRSSFGSKDKDKEN